MSLIPTIIICPEEQAAKMSVVWEAMGQGPNVFLQARTLCAIPAPQELEDPENPQPPTEPAPLVVTHRLINDAALPLAVEDMARKMATGEAMPPQNWSEFTTQDNVQITESEAIAAARSITVISTAGALACAGDLDKLLAVYGLQLTPSPVY